MSAEAEMNATGIEVPLELPAPHFDDEATVATARQVVPIERARTIEFWRKVRKLLPILLAAMFCGGLGAAAVNYYEHRPVTQAVSPQTSITSSQAPVSAPSPVVVAATSESDAKWHGSEGSENKSEDSSTKTGQQAADAQGQTVSVTSTNDSSEAATSKIKRISSDPDSEKLTRKRRVHPAAEAAAPAKRSGAGRIVDVFTGPNPR